MLGWNLIGIVRLRGKASYLLFLSFLSHFFIFLSFLRELYQKCQNTIFNSLGSRYEIVLHYRVTTLVTKTCLLKVELDWSSHAFRRFLWMSQSSVLPSSDLNGSHLTFLGG